MNDWLDEVLGRFRATYQLSSCLPTFLEACMDGTSSFLTVFQVGKGRHHLHKDLDGLQLGSFLGSGWESFIEDFVLDAAQKVRMRSLEGKRRNSIVVDDVVYLLAHERMERLGERRKDRSHGVLFDRKRYWC
jgi:hypothetical protein